MPSHCTSTDTSVSAGATSGNVIAVYTPGCPASRRAMRDPDIGVITSPRADTADSTIVTSGLVGTSKPPQFTSPGERGSKSVVLAAHTVVPSGVWLAVCDEEAVLDDDAVPVWLDVCDELGVPVWLDVCDDDAVCVADDEAVKEDVAVPVLLEDGVPV